MCVGQILRGCVNDRVHEHGHGLHDRDFLLHERVRGLSDRDFLLHEHGHGLHASLLHERGHGLHVHGHDHGYL